MNSFPRRSNMYSIIRRSILLQLCRLVVYICLFCTVLVSAVLSKLWFFSIVANYSKSKGSKRLEFANVLLLCIAVPYFVTLCKSLINVAITRRNPLQLRHILPLLYVEALQTVGLSLMVFQVLPHYDTFSGILIILSLVVIPSFTTLVGKAYTAGRLTPFRLCAVITVVLVFATQTKYLMSLYNYTIGEKATSHNLTFLVACVLMSIKWCINIYLEKFVGFKRWFKLDNDKLVNKLDEVNHIYEFMVSLVKLITFLLCSRHIISRDNLAVNTTVAQIGSVLQHGFFNDFKTGFSVFRQFSVDYHHIINVLGCAIVFTYATRLACRLRMQYVAFLLPVILISPLSMGIVFFKCRHTPFLHGLVPDNIYCPTLDFHSLEISFAVGVLLCSCVLVITWIIWKPKCERIEIYESICEFRHIHYTYVFSDINILFQHNVDDKHAAPIVCVNGNNNGNNNNNNNNNTLDTPFVYLCATMWHETRDEMSQVLNSMFRIDKYCTANRKNKKLHEDTSPGKFHPEVHIIFDDAFVEDPKSGQTTPNDFVVQLTECYNDAFAKFVLDDKSASNTKYENISWTPYGGRIEWTMPGGTHILVHLKDKSKVRHRKRWSQIFYICYLLGYKRFLGNTDTETVTAHSKENPEKQHQLNNTFILALDGDVDFQPEALLLVLERMKSNNKIGAVCGRLHPTGTGPTVWYQIFEYAVGHWFSKTTEQMFGHILCCPGCFSLLRGSAIMDERVLQTFTADPNEVMQFIQFEQGEDRWLTTLLIQNGYKTEYVADAHVMTNAPENIKELFTQRRRWMTSQIPNDLEILKTYPRWSVYTDSTIGLWSVVYQLIMMVSNFSITTGLIFLIYCMLYHTFNINWFLSVVSACFPWSLFMYACLKCRDDVQVKTAAVMTAVYTVGIGCTVVGTVARAFNGNFSLDVLTVFGVCFVFTISSLAHPKELRCSIYMLFYCLIYLPLQSSMVIYCLCNMNNITWGTRETQNDQLKDNAKVTPGSIANAHENVIMSFQQEKQAKGVALFRHAVELMKQYFIKHKTNGFVQSRNAKRNNSETQFETQVKSEETKVEMVNNFVTAWQELCKIPKIGNKDEIHFWQDLIKKCLFPKHLYDTDKANLGKDLLKLRNKVICMFLLVNITLFVLLMVLQMESIKAFLSLEETSIHSFVLVSPLLSIVGIQILAQFTERWNTLEHNIANTLLWSLDDAPCKRPADRLDHI